MLLLVLSSIGYKKFKKSNPIMINLILYYLAPSHFGQSHTLIAKYNQWDVTKVGKIRETIPQLNFDSTSITIRLKIPNVKPMGIVIVAIGNSDSNTNLNVLKKFSFQGTQDTSYIDFARIRVSSILDTFKSSIAITWFSFIIL